MRHQFYYSALLAGSKRGARLPWVLPGLAFGLQAMCLHMAQPVLAGPAADRHRRASAVATCVGRSSAKALTLPFRIADTSGCDSGIPAVRSRVVTSA